MKLLVNQLLKRHSEADSDISIERVLWLDLSGTDVVTIDIYHHLAQPIWHKYQNIELAIASQIISICSEDPYANLQIVSEQLTQAERQYRDTAWSIIAPIIAAGPLVFDKKQRSQLIKQAVHHTGRSEPTIRKDLRRYWQGGQTINALLPHFNLCGGSGKPRHSNGSKLGRPSLLSIALGKPLGVNIDADSQKKFRQGIRLFYENRQKRPLTQAYQLTLEKFFAIDYEQLPDGAVRPILPPAEQLPSWEQFKYWYEKNCDINKKISTREGERRYHLSHRATLGDSTQMAFGSGSLYQIDATIADVYLVSSLNRNWIIGRPTLYLVIDVFSRLIVGFVVTLEPPSWLGAMLALENVAENKVEFCAFYGIEITANQWPSHYLPTAILADRGEFEGYNANNLVEALGIQVCNTPPYRADLKGIIERSFRSFNDETIHWFPGAVKKLPERGERDRRLDGVLTLHEFRQLIILGILDHNNSKRLEQYPLNEFMISDELVPYPVNLWQWGVENRVGSLHWQPLEIVRLNLLPSEKAAVTRDGIYFKKLHYTCELALREHWFVKARNQGSWRIDVAYDPRRVDNIYIRLERGKTIEVCHLLEVEQRFSGCDFREVEDYYKRQKIKAQTARTQQQQSQATLHAQSKQIVTKATEETHKATLGSSKSSRLENIRFNREQARQEERKKQAWNLNPECVAQPPEPITVTPIMPEPETDESGYVPPHRPINKLRKSRQSKLNNDPQ